MVRYSGVSLAHMVKTVSRIELKMNPGDEVSEVTVRLSSDLVSCLRENEPRAPISSLLSREDGRPIEISDLQVSAPTMNSRRRTESASAEIYVDGLGSTVFRR